MLLSENEGDLQEKKKERKKKRKRGGNLGTFYNDFLYK